ncbi:MAG: 30S ribosomal protein S2 [Actinobacteria bacterium RBG_19FT_COMBO_54_7]|nr:MAG: 30S ribosomal protein S2 [Actinobacteria bacterium RBG_19FT_COMBO_54_7]
MQGLPTAVFIIDPRKENIALLEARKLDIPIIAVVDTNCDPDMVDFVIPGNDDAIRAANLISKIIANAVLEGKQLREAIQGREREAEVAAEAVAEAEVAQAEAQGEEEKV